MKYFLAIGLLTACLCPAQTTPGTGDVRTAHPQVSGNAVYSDASAVYPYVDVRAYGAVGDGKILGGGGAGCSIAGGTATLTCPSGTFASGDVGKAINISEAGTATGCTAGHPNGKCPFKTTILSYTDSAHVTLAASVTSTVSNTPIMFGTNNRAAIQAAIDFASNSQTSQFDVYIPHALGQGTAGGTVEPGCYLIDGTIKLPNSSQNQFKWVRLRGDGNTASEICEADWTKDVFSISFPGGAGTEFWFKDFGVHGAANYYSPSGIHCMRCIEIRVEGMWFSGFQDAILADVDGSNSQSQLLKIWGNTFEFTYSALKWVRGAGLTSFQSLDMHDNMIDIGSFNWAVDGNGNPLYPYSVDLNEVISAKIYGNLFWGLGRGIRCIDCPELDISNNDFAFMGNSLLGDSAANYGYQNLSLSGTGIHYARRQNIHDNHFGSSNAEAVDVVGDVVASFYHNQFSYNPVNRNTEPYMSVTASGGVNTLNIRNEVIDASASPAISVASGSLAAGSIISDNYFASSITTPISVAAGSVVSGVYVALHSGEAAGNKADFAGYQVNGINGFTGTKKVGSCVLTVSSGIITNITGC
jgi:hypothetical protein